MGTVVRLEDYCKSFKSAEVLKNINLTLESGKVIGLKGKNGSGKTMLMRAISGLILPTSGKVYINDKELGRQISFPPSIGILIENPSFISNYTGFKNLKILASIQNRISDDEIRDAIRKVGLDPDDKRTFKKYSLGMKQRLGIAAAIMERPDIVILDEPFSGLDPVNSRILQDVVMELIGQNKIVIFSSHQMSYVEEFCRDIAIIDKGNIALAGNLKDIKRQYGENQLVISDVNMGLDELSQIIKDNVSDIITETGRTREEIIVRNINGVSRADILKRMIACGIEIEHFETYKPSLNDIFVSLVGDDMEDDKVVDYKNNSNDDNSYNRDIVDELPQGESSEHKKSVEGGVR